MAPVLSACVDGVEARPVEVEAALAQGLPSFTIVGLTDRAVQEARERVKAAVGSSGFAFPQRRLVVNLAPAQMPKEGSSFDTAIAVAVLRASGVDGLDGGRPGFIGELGLDGSIRRVRGALALSLSLARAGATSLFVPAANADEAACARVPVHPVTRLEQVVKHLRGEELVLCHEPSPRRGGEPRPPLDLLDIQQQETGKRALEIAAAGGHHLLLTGPPGAGKSMLARAMAGLLPDLSDEESQEVTMIHSVGGLWAGGGLIARPPARSPHHSISSAGLLGGGTVFRPGEVTLAHRGLLILDELPEFQRHCLEALREPLEDGWLRLSRAAGTRHLPATFTMVATSNPCPCGAATTDRAGRRRDCNCPPEVVARYQRRISGPLRDRMDLVVEVLPVRLRGITATVAGAESSEVVRERVAAARHRQEARQGPGRLNHSLHARELERHCPLSPKTAALLGRVADTYSLSGRGFHAALRVARSIADLAGSDAIEEQHLLEACTYRAA